jgi:hypothetical protein
MAFREHEYHLERPWNPHRSPTPEFATSYATRQNQQFYEGECDSCTCLSLTEISAENSTGKNEGISEGNTDLFKRTLVIVLLE